MDDDANDDGGGVDDDDVGDDIPCRCLTHLLSTASPPLLNQSTNRPLDVVVVSPAAVVATVALKLHDISRINQNNRHC